MVLGASTIDPTLYDVLLELGLDAAEAEVMAQNPCSFEEIGCEEGGEPKNKARI